MKLHQRISTVVIACRVQLTGLVRILRVFPGCLRLVLLSKSRTVLVAEILKIQALQLGALVRLVKIPLRLRAPEALCPQIGCGHLGDLVRAAGSGFGLSFFK